MLRALKRKYLHSVPQAVEPGSVLIHLQSGHRAGHQVGSASNTENDHNTIFKAIPSPRFCQYYYCDCCYLQPDAFSEVMYL